MAMFNYESEALYQQARGEKIPSSSVYVAECKKEIIDEVNPNYPQLVEYEKEWINFAQHVYHEGTPVPLEYQEVNTYEPTSVENAIPFYYKSASLKGNTLVNHFDLSSWGEQGRITLVADGKAKTIKLGSPSTVKKSTKYLTIIPIYENTINNKLSIGGWNYCETQALIKSDDGIGIIKKILTTKNTDDAFHYGMYIELWQENTSGQITLGKPMLIEYQEGMENWDISYFEGMKSVKMPTLTTSNEDGTKTNILTVNEDVELRGIGEVQDELDLFTGELTQRIDEVVFDGSEDWQIDSDTNDYRLALSLKHNGKMIKYTQSICDKYPTKTSKQSNSTLTNYMYIGGSSINLYEKPTMTLEEFKSKLKQNPMTFQYQSTTESIKTVDLKQTIKSIKSYEGTNHYKVSSDTIPPQLLLSVPVVSTGAKTLNDIITEE